MLDSEVHAATHPAKNIMVYYFLNQSMVKGYILSIFSKAKYASNDHAAWKNWLSGMKEVSRGNQK